MAGIIVDIAARTKQFNRGMMRLRKTVSRMAMWLPKKFARMGVRAARALTGALIRNVRRAAVGVGAALVAGIGKSVSEAGRFEAYEMQFEALLGSAEEARKRMDEIRKLDLEVPFDITGITDASRILTVFTENAFASTEALRMMADAAAVTPNNIEQVAFWYGRAYSMIKAGRPFGEAAMRLQEMGLITGRARTEMEKLSKVRGPAAVEKMLEVLDAEFLKFQGSALKLSKTWKGVMSIFTSATKQTFEAVGKEILPLAKTWLAELISKMQELKANGTLTRWGQNVSYWMHNARRVIEDSIPTIITKVGELWTEFTKFYESIKGQTWSETIGNGIESGLKKAFDAIKNFASNNKEEIAEAGKNIGKGIAKGIGYGIWEGLKGSAQELKRVPVLGKQIKGFEKAVEIAGFIDYYGTKGGMTGDMSAIPKIGAKASSGYFKAQGMASTVAKAGSPLHLMDAFGKGARQAIKVHLVQDDTKVKGGV